MVKNLNQFKSKDQIYRENNISIKFNNFMIHVHMLREFHVPSMDGLRYLDIDIKLSIENLKYLNKFASK